MEQSFWLQTEDNSEVYVRYWDECENPKAIIQISHGMAEHIARYDDFASHLNQQGYIVYGDDHRGHGKTGDKQGLLGYFADEKGFDLLVEDMHLLTKHIQTKHPNLPIILFGHSMGSFIARNFLQKYSNEIAGVILSGTGYFPIMSSYLGRMIASFLPSRRQSKLMDALVFGNYNTKVKDKRTNFDWLTRDEQIVDAYINDPFAGYIPTGRFFFDLLSGILTMQHDKQNIAIRKDLPMLFLSGDQDPVGNYGKGVFRAAESYNQAGIDNIVVKTFTDARHELHNETNKEQIYGTIKKWIATQGY